jgi:hypothetical protein
MATGLPLEVCRPDTTNHTGSLTAHLANGFGVSPETETSYPELYFWAG